MGASLKIENSAAICPSHPAARVHPQEVKPVIWKGKLHSHGHCSIARSKPEVQSASGSASGCVCAQQNTIQP